MDATIKLSLSSMLFVSLIPVTFAFMPQVQSSPEQSENIASPRTLQVPTTPYIQSTPSQNTANTASPSRQQSSQPARNTSHPQSPPTKQSAANKQSSQSAKSTSAQQTPPPKQSNTASKQSSQAAKNPSKQQTKQSPSSQQSTQNTSSSQGTLSPRHTPQTAAGASTAQSPPNAKNAKAATTITAPLRMRIVEQRPLKLGQPTNFVAYLYDKKGPVRPEQLSPSAHNHLRLTLIDPSLSQVVSIYPHAKDNNGYYKFHATFDKAGEYAVTAEVTDAQGNVYTPNGFFTVAGQPQLISKSNHLAPGTIEAHQTIGDLHFSATTTSKYIRANQLVILDITAKHLTGEFHKALEPHVDQYAHLVGISEDRNILINVDPINRKPQSATHLSGPDVRFKLLFPKAGFYRLWAQFQIDGKPVAVPYDVEVLA